MNRRTYATTIVSLTAGSLLAGCTGSDEGDTAGGTNNDNDDSDSDDSDADTETAEPEPETEETPDVTILDHELITTDLDYAEVAGTVQNTSGDEQSYVAVEAKFFDADDTRIGDSVWNAQDVADDQKVKFETVLSTTEAADVERYEIEAATSAF